MAASRRVLCLVAVVLVVLAAGAVPALGQDFDFTAVPRVTIGLTNRGPVGALCASGLLNFSPGTAPGTITATLLSGTDVRCQDSESSASISGGSLTFFSGNRSVVGTLGGETLFGQALPAGHGLVAVDTFDLESVVPGGVGLTVLIEPHGTPFTQSNLAGTWRITALTGEQGPEGTSEKAFGSISFGSTGLVTGGSLLLPFRTDSIVSGNVTVASNGRLAGFVVTADGDFPTTVDVQGLMAPDKNFVAGVSSIDTAGTFKNGMFFLQREPAGTSYATSNLAGTWNIFSLQAVASDSSDGTWFRGTVTFDATGHITTSTLVNADGLAFPGVDVGSFTVSPQGVIEGGASFVDESVLSVKATMFKDKNQIIGVNEFTDGGFVTFGLFAMFKQGPPPPASVVQFSTGNYSVTEGATAAITVTRSGATSTRVTVDFLASDPFVDGSLASGTLVIPAGATSRTFTVPTFGNLAVDADRVVRLSLGNPTNGATLGTRSTANLDVLNDDSSFAFARPTYTVSEKAGRASIAVTRSGALAFPASVPFTISPGTASLGKDFTCPCSGNLSFAKNIATATFDVLVKDNAVLDGNRSVVLELFPPVVAGRPASLAPPPLPTHPTATLVITDDDTPGVVQLGSATYSGNEGTSVTISILRSAMGGAPLGGNVSVDYTTSNNGSAVGGLDYAVSTGTVTFTGTQTMQSVMIPLIKDNVAEGPEHFLFSLRNPTNGATLGTPATATIKINDIDTGGVVSLSAGSYSVTEGAGNVSITVRRAGGAAANVSVLFTTSNGTATAGGDYGSVSTTVVFGFNETTKTVVVPIFQDTEAEGNETFTVALSNVQGGARLGSPSSATVTIVDDESTIQFERPAFSAREGTAGVINVIRTGALLTPAVVSFDVSALTALPGRDFTPPASTTLTFAPRVGKVSFTIPTLPNTIVDGNRSVLLALGSPTGGAQLGANATATFTIVDDDQPGVFRIGSPAYTVAEGGSVVVDIVRSLAPGLSGPLAGNISVSYATSSGDASAGSDFIPVSNTVVFCPLQTRKSITVQTRQDTIVETAENFVFTLSAPTGGAALGSPSTASILIRDDDSAGVVFLARKAYSVSEGAGNVSITVMRTGGTANASVQYVATSGTAILGDDFTLEPGTLVFPPGVSTRTIPIKTTDDNIAEGPETFTITLMNPSPPAQLGPFFEQVFTLSDNDFGGVVSFSNASPTAVLGQSTPITILRAGGLGTVMTVGWSAIGGTGVAGTDFSPASGQVTFLANQSAQTFFVNVGSGPATAGKTIVFGLMPPGLDAVPPSSRLGAANTSTLTIVGAPPSVIQFSSAEYSVTEDAGFATITVKRTGDLSLPAFVDYDTSNGTATTSSEDYGRASGTLTFPASEGSYQHATFTVDVIDDGVAEGPETVNLTLSDPRGNAVLGARATAVLTINDPVPTGYRFTVLYSGAASVGLPSINDNLGFAFSVDNGTQTIYSGNMETPTDLRTAATLPSGDVGSLQGFRFPADRGETVAFLASFGSGGGIALASNSSARVFYASSATVGEPSFSLDGQLAFKATVDCGDPCEALLLGTAASVAVGAEEGDTTDVGFLETILPNTAVNDGGLAAFIGTTFSGNKGVFTTLGGGAITTVASTASGFTDVGDRVSINNAGAVAFIGTLPDGNRSIVLAYDGGLMPIATTGTGFTGFGTAGEASPVIGNNDAVAFLAFLAGGGSGIFTGPDPVANKVVATGDVIDGRTVTALRVGGINSIGQISFLAVLSDGAISEVAAIVATPPPR